MSPSTDHPKAVVLGLDSMQGLQTARILAAAGVRVIAYSNTRRHHATFTRVCEEIRHVGSEDQLLADLDLLGRRTSARPVLVPCTDGKVLSVSKSRAALSERFEIVLPEHDVIETFMDKGRFAAYAERAGFPVPRSRTVTTDDDFEAAVADFEFPLVIKPTYRSKLWTGHTSDKAFELPDEVTARAVWGRVRHWAKQFVVQEWVRGGAEELYSCNTYFSREGELLVSFVARKLRQWPVDTGQSAFGEEVRNDAVRDMAIKLLQSVAYRGLGYVEIKRDAVDGRYRIIEPNVGRPTGRSAIAEGGGVALLYTMYCDAAGLALPPDREQRYTGVKWIHLRRDLQAALTMRRRKELRVADWFRSLRGKKVYAVWSWRDPMPFFVDIAEALAKLARRRSAE